MMAVCQSLVDELYAVTFEQLARLGIAPSHQAQITPEELNALRAKLSSFAIAPTLMPGGAAYNSLCHYALLGGEALLVARYGRGRDSELDAAGKACSEHASRCGVQVRSTLDENLPTGTSVVLTAPDGSRCMLTCLGASSIFDSEGFAQPPLPSGSWIILEGYMLGIPGGAPLRYVKEQCASGCKLAINIAAPWVPTQFSEALAEALSLATVVFLNEHEAAAFYREGAKSPAELSRVLGTETRLAVVTNGEKGAFISGMGHSLHAPARKVSVVDSTGAGDSFAAAFLRGLVAGAAMERVAAGAAFLASEVIQHPGAFPPSNLREGWNRIVF
jgi:sugar/nucleoside kinase (ribokinase family)